MTPHSSTGLISGVSGVYHNLQMHVSSPCSVGRDAGNTLSLPLDSAVSSRHCVIRQEGNAWLLCDQGSTNGTYLNGHRVTTVRLNPGDCITIGGSTFVFSHSSVSPGPALNKPMPSYLVWLPFLLAAIALVFWMTTFAGVKKLGNFSAERSPSESGSSGLFTESASTQEQPILKLYTDVEGGAALTLTDESGQRYTCQFSPVQSGSLQVPPGSYSVEVSSLDGSIDSNSGTGTFRRYKQYEATFVVVSADDVSPLRLGDDE